MPADLSAAAQSCSSAGDAHAAFADQRERQMRERREIAGGADRALARHHRIDPGIDELQQALDHERAHAGKSAREARGLQHQDEPHRGIRKRRADTRGMRAHEIELERRELVVGDPRLRELAEAGIDSVERFARLEPRANRGERLLDRPTPALRERNGIGTARDADEAPRAKSSPASV